MAHLTNEEIDNLMSMTPLQCYQKFKRPYSESLHERLLKRVVEQGNRIFCIEYGNPLLTYHKAIAYFGFIRPDRSIGHDLLMDAPHNSRPKNR
jgi:hypothetical protein